MLDLLDARLSYLEKIKGLSYNDMFIDSNNNECLIRGCKGRIYAFKKSLYWHVKESKNREHSIAFFFLKQPHCYRCNKALRSEQSNVQNERCSHGDTYDRRFENFRRMFKQFRHKIPPLTASAPPRNRHIRHSSASAATVQLSQCDGASSTIPEKLMIESLSETVRSSHKPPLTSIGTQASSNASCLLSWCHSSDPSALIKPCLHSGH